MQMRIGLAQLLLGPAGQGIRSVAAHSDCLLAVTNDTCFLKFDWFLQMRIGLARLLLGPAGQSASSGGQGGLLLLDEPTNHLDK